MDSKRTLEGEGELNDVRYKRHQLLTFLKDDEGYRLERMFADKVKEPMLAPLVTIIQGLMRFLPFHRITADEALGSLEAATEQGYE